MQWPTELGAARTASSPAPAAERPSVSSPAGSAHAERLSGWLRAALGVALPDGLLALALTHRSYACENGGMPTNERLERLGDAVLGVVVTDALYRRRPDLSEGQLAKLRAAVVDMPSLATVARRLGNGGVGPHLLLGRGEEVSGGRDNSPILANTMGALIGAVHVGVGLDVAAAMVQRIFDPLWTEAAIRGVSLDWKTSLQFNVASVCGHQPLPPSEPPSE
jgi:ribonuclease-3